jgi:hypothetical protein
MTLDQVRRLALKLPEVIEAPHFNYTSFRVAGKIIATAPPEENFVHIFVPEEDRERTLALEPQSVEKLFWGAKAIGLRIRLAKARPAMVESLLTKAWELRARKPPVKASSKARKQRRE